MKKTLLFSLFSVLIISLASASQASAYDIYVNQASSSETENGTQTDPFKTITAATAKAETMPDGQRNIFIANGTYTENLVLAASMSLTGENKNTTIINGNGENHTLEITATSDISNLTVSEGYVGIYIDKNAGAKIKSCKISKTEKMGIEIEESSTSNSNKVTVTKSDISKNEGKGFYIKKRKILIEDSTVEDNDEEGIDIRSGVKGTIKKNTIAKNGESGIELVTGKSGLKITSNKIKNNSASGISNQFYKESKKIGDIQISKNRIQKNDNYGVQCATPSGGNVPNNYWTKSIDLSKNIFSNNGSIFAKRCGFIIAKK
ncbi:MAG: hypothetical protein UT41_C0006G0003 [Candidatus Wolfebacteria bacterium GW2011_GWC2_39_22]|uniref:Right handed beta helix domain-containing protein n=1 Tax=Candidatus Wolfebacteria bacterium GW2011_GWC2_39_22 TaxID=1619013 RepID=A0A0G0N8N6_9BACT|nr:MAG: hypothetical protein UT41_C0006G0003 [Candidatus Wolfebacteria bacterium GW2011_GWC2_39_22]